MINYKDLTLILKFSIMAFNYEPQFLKEQFPPTRIFYKENYYEIRILYIAYDSILSSFDPTWLHNIRYSWN